MRINGNKRAGFTLIELLTAIAIIAILATMLLPLGGRVRSAAQQAQCASNMRQIGIALHMFAHDHGGALPGVAHLRVEESWVFSLSPYLDNVHEVRICPADPRADRMRAVDWATSYVMNDIIFMAAYDEFGQPVGGNFRDLNRLQSPSQTIVAFIGADHRGIAPSDDHTHARTWSNNWGAVLNDIAPDRFHAGIRSQDRTNGTANYLFADAHVARMAASEVRNQIDAGINIALPPEVR